MSKRPTPRTANVYILDCDFPTETLYKIGFGNIPKSRHKGLRTGIPVPSDFELYGEVERASTTEADIHQILAGSRVIVQIERRKTEFFRLDDEQLTWLRWKLHGPLSYRTLAKPERMLSLASVRNELRKRYFDRDRLLPVLRDLFERNQGRPPHEVLFDFLHELYRERPDILVVRDPAFPRVLQRIAEQITQE